MKSVLMRLEGPLQAWSTQGKFGIRDSDREPSKSGVLGLVAAAMGVERGDDEALAELRSLSLAVRVDRPGSLLRDFHTAGGGRFRGGAYVVHGVKDCVPSQRFYLQDASFIVALGGDDALVERIAVALRSPRWPLFLGRRSCPPSRPIFIAVVDGPAHEAVRGAELPEVEHGGDDDVDAGREPLRLIVEVPAEEGGEPRYDDPLSFTEGARRYGVRHVRVEWMEVSRGE